MKLILKFNLVLLIVFLAGLALSAFATRQLLQRNATDEIHENARIMMESAVAARVYTVSQIKPLLSTQTHYQFLPQTIPAYAATEIFNNLRKKFPDYSYKEATLNPTNPRDRAVEWEVDVVNHFRDNADQKEIIGERDSPTGRTLYMARPLRITDPACLECHSTPDAAPMTFRDKYGDANGFNWVLNDVVAAQIVSVPMTVADRRADGTFRFVLELLVGLFAFLFVIMNLLLYALVIRPVRKLAKIAKQVSDGEMDAPEFPVGSRDEIGDLAQSFRLLRRSLEIAMGREF